MVVDDGGDPHQVLPGRADAGDPAGAPRWARPQKGIVDQVGSLPPERGRRLDTDSSALDSQDRRLGRPAGDDDGIITRLAHLGPEKAAAVGIAIGASERGFKGHVQPG